ncbi:hypothetical protein [Prauserella cavernicola]|uniref:Uncharacterized protein n=1 Tax=Prauserella cavernicola TaxID=2800127 RepID=A0A934QW64_9PSEU|nr:hypothetical protein [Prauserella cavernicola]MBK1787292.1 hypothetical protein [Prauserella cavernicola]
MSTTTLAHDPLVRTAPAGIEPGWFDRFYVNVHAGPVAPMFMIGAGVYPAESLVDGYAVAVTAKEQINLRVSDVVTGSTLPGAVGPLSWEVVEPAVRWRVRVAENPSGIACDLTWTARTAPWGCDEIVLSDGNEVRTFDHSFQSGHHEGWVEVDGVRTEIAGWTGQHDRSRGRRHATAGQGLHLWVQGQFAADSVAFMLDLDRDNVHTLLDGAVLAADGSTDRIVAVEHELSFDDDLETPGGRLGLTTESGRAFELLVDSAATRGGFLEGAGYGRFHGKPQGSGHVEHDRWDLLDPANIPRNLGYPLTDRLSGFTRVEGGTSEQGAGIFEFAHSRSPRYRYRPGSARR